MLTPQEVSSKTFPKAVMGGYAMAAVDEFLDALTEDYTNLYKETAALKTKVKALMEQMEEYRQVEDAMRSTLLAAQRTAKEIVSEAEQKRDALAAEAEERKQTLVSGAETAARERVAQLADQVAGEEKRLADTMERVAAEIAAQAQKLEKAKQVVSRYLQVTRANCEEQLKVLERLEELAPEAIEVPAAPVRPAPAPQTPAAPQEVPAEPEPVQEPEVRVEEDFFTMPLPTMEDIKKVQAKKPDIAETVEEDGAANVQAAMDALAVEEDSLWDSLPEDATRVIKLDELQFGRNYKKEK